MMPSLHLRPVQFVDSPVGYPDGAVARRLGVGGGGLGRVSLALLVAMSVGGLLLRLPAAL